MHDHGHPHDHHHHGSELSPIEARVRALESILVEKGYVDPAALDAIIDTAGVAPGRYFLYAKNLDHLSNDTEDFGGMMTEIVVTP